MGDFIDATPTPPPAPVLNRKGFPTLFEVLSRRTLAPIDLFSFYIFMRDVKQSVDYLDFWLDVSQHMSLCRHYVRQLRRSTLLETPELEKSASKRSSGILGDPGPSEKFGHGLDNDPQRISAFLRSDSASKHSPQNSQHSNRSMGPGDALPRPSFLASTPAGSSPGQDSSSPGQDSGRNDAQPTVTREHIRMSAEKILYMYLIPNAEREIILPQGMLNDIHEAVEQHGRDDPEVFDEAKDYVFQAMERDAFRDFLNHKGLGNLVSSHLMLRMVVGLTCMFAGWVLAFSFVFLDFARLDRVWVLLPFFLGCYLLASHQFMLDPILALANKSEYTFMNFHHVKEPYVRQVQHQRAVWLLLLQLLLVAALVCLFVFVPGKRL